MLTLVRISPLLVISIILELCSVATLSAMAVKPTETEMELEPRLLSGEIEGALYEIKVPSSSNGRLLLLAHGYRPATVPISADFGSSHGFYDHLVEDGWTVASSSYRRNGWIMQDAAHDLINLKECATEEIGAFERVYLAGNSMGGGIVTWLAEHSPDGFDGALAMGAYLFEPIQAEGPRSAKLANYFSGKPGIPILYLTNISELEGPEAYIALATSKASSPRPVMRRVQRAGHVNVNYAEEESALETLVRWVETGEVDSNADGTIQMNPSSTALIEDGVATGAVHQLVPVYGNVITTFVPSDLEMLCIEKGDTFILSVEGHQAEVLSGSDYGDVSVGKWVAFLNAEGYMLICRNYKDAVGSLGLTPSSVIKIKSE